MFGVLERLFVREQAPGRLVLREYPLLPWLFAGALIVGAGNLWLVEAEVSAVAALVMGSFLFAWAQVRTVTFDAAQGVLRVRLSALLRQRTALERPLADLSRAYVKAFPSGHTQIVLRFHDGSETGLSVYSRDIADWKTPLTEQINAVLS